MEGFDFDISTDGELVINSENHDINKIIDDDLRIQLAYNRIKSISNNWFIDNIGADLEELIGKPCNEKTTEYGKLKITESLTKDGLWNSNDIFIKAEIRNNINVIYNIYLRLFQSKTEETISFEIVVELDLIKGVFIRYGWNSRR